VLTPFIIFVLFVLAYGVRLNFPPHSYFDESLYAFTARSILHLCGTIDVHHPPLGKLLIALGIHCCGDNTWGWRLPSLICGAAATALSGYLAFLLTGNKRLFWLVSLLLSLDGLWITQARLGQLNAPMIFFIMAALVSWWHARIDPLNRRRYWILSGTCAGLAMACKWQGALVILIPFIYEILSPMRNINKMKTFWIYLLAAMFIAYFCTFLFIPMMPGWRWIMILKLQAKIIHFFVTLHEPYYYASAWYTWPFLIRPVLLFYSNLSFDAVSSILCIGNPAIFILIFPAIWWMVRILRRDKTPLSIIALSGFFIFWMSSAFFDQNWTVLIYFYPVLPFAVMAIAVMLDNMWESKQHVQRLLTAFLVFLILLSYFFFFPLWTGFPISPTYFAQHLWLSSWGLK